MKDKCEYCGKSLKENADLCLNCGKLVKREEKNREQKETTNIERKSENKIPANGKSIAGMVLGIVAATWSFFELLSLSMISPILNELLYYNYYTSGAIIKISFAVGYTLFSLVPSLVGLPLSVIGYNKKKTGKNGSGIILNTVGLAFSLIIYIYIMMCA